MTLPEKTKILPASASPEQAHALFYAKKYTEAVPAYQALLTKRRDDFFIWGNLGIALRETGEVEAAALCLKRASELRPASHDVLWHYAHSLALLQRYDEALKTFERALALKADDFNVHLFYAGALREVGRYEDALTHFRAAATIEPDNPEPVYQTAEILLRLGRFEEGWKAYEYRWLTHGPLTTHSAVHAWREKFKSKDWRGENLAGKTIIVCTEQGFGDTILCSRYFRHVKARGGRVLFDCTPHLQRLFKTVPGIDCFVTLEECDEKIDYHVPLMSLPGLFKTDLSTIDPPPPFYIPDEVPHEAARLLAPGASRLKVGIVWSGSYTYRENKTRAVSLSRFLPLAEIPGVQLYSLQKGPQEKELADTAAFGLIPALGPHLNDFADTAAALKQLDLVIMTDSSVAHLAGSIGVPVWNLVPFRPYWLYLMDRDDSPWYPSMRLFRQPAPGEWDSVFANVARELRKMAAAKKNRI